MSSSFHITGQRSATREATISDDDWQAIVELEAIEPIRQAGRAMLRRLSPRETDVLRGVVAGCPNKVIARRLNLSVKTVEKYRSSLMRKLEVKTLPDLMRIWLQANPLDLRVFQP